MRLRFNFLISGIILMIIVVSGGEKIKPGSSFRKVAGPQAEPNELQPI